MEGTDLMIGDWVGVFDDEGIIKDCRQVDWVRTGEIGMRYHKVWAIGCIEPIPLTAEILEKNGFVLRGKTYILKWRGADIHWRKTDGYASITAPNNLKFEGWYSISNGYFCYVHILQHALRLCGLDELADNFKV